MRFPHQKFIDWLFAQYYDRNEEAAMKYRYMRKRGLRIYNRFVDYEASRWVRQQMLEYPYVYVPDVEEIGKPYYAISKFYANGGTLISMPSQVYSMLTNARLRTIIEIMYIYGYDIESIVKEANAMVPNRAFYNENTIRGYLQWFWDWNELEFAEKYNFISKIRTAKGWAVLTPDGVSGYNDFGVPIVNEKDDRDTVIHKYYELHAKAFWGEKTPEFILAAAGLKNIDDTIASGVKRSMIMVSQNLEDAIKHGHAALAMEWSKTFKNIAEAFSKMQAGEEAAEALSRFIELVSASEEKLSDIIGKDKPALDFSLTKDDIYRENNEL